MKPIRLSLALAALAATAHSQSFSDQSAASGTALSHAGLPDTMDGGSVFFDYDGDRDLDLFVTNGRQACRLFRNQGNGAFVDVAAAAGLGALRRTWGASAADYDNDGDPDLFVTGVSLDNLMRNNGDGTFTDVTNAAGVQDVHVTTAASWADYDGDGWLDLYLGNYVGEPNFPYHQGAPNRLFHNNRNGTFTDLAPQLRVICDDLYPAGAPSPGTQAIGCTLSVLWLDHDDDGDPDLFVGNDFGPFVCPNKLYRNDGPSAGPGGWTFTDVSVPAGFDIHEFNMGISPGDIDGDGDLDLYTSNLGDNHLLRNDGNGSFTDITAAAGPVEGRMNNLLLTSWASVFEDFDNDGDVDLYVVNGFIQTVPAMANEPLAPNSLWMNIGANAFQRASIPLLEDTGLGRGLSSGDYDFDGDSDLYLVNNGGPCRLFRNDSPARSWVQVAARGTTSNRDAIGTRVEVSAGGRRLVREIHAGSSYNSMHAKDPQFGLGTADRIDRLRLRWRSGTVQDLHNLPAGAKYDIVEPFADLTVAQGPRLVNQRLEFPFECRVPGAASTYTFAMLEVELQGFWPPVTFVESRTMTPGSAQQTFWVPAPRNSIWPLHGTPVTLRYRLFSNVGGIVTVDEQVLQTRLP
jgi:hypothetical protein